MAGTKEIKGHVAVEGNLYINDPDESGFSIRGNVDAGAIYATGDIYTEKDLTAERNLMVEGSLSIGGGATINGILTTDTSPLLLGAFDTISKDLVGGQHVYTITRQTGYLTFTPDMFGTSTNTEGLRVTYVQTGQLNSRSANDIRSNLPTSGAGWYSAVEGIEVRSGGEEFRIYTDPLRKDPVYIQYKLAFSTTEKVEVNHLADSKQEYVNQQLMEAANKGVNLLSRYYTQWGPVAARAPVCRANFTFKKDKVYRISFIVDNFVSGCMYLNENYFTATTSDQSEGGTYFRTDQNGGIGRAIASGDSTIYYVSRYVKMLQDVVVSSSQPLIKNAGTERVYKLRCLTITEGVKLYPYSDNNVFTFFEGKIAHQNDVDRSLYNLGAFDNVVDNGDGTVTIYRRTGKTNLSRTVLKAIEDASITGISVRGTVGTLHELGKDGWLPGFIPGTSGARESGIALGYPDIAVGATGDVYTYSDKDWVSNTWIALNKSVPGASTIDAYKKYFEENDIYLDYELAVALVETVEKKNVVSALSKEEAGELAKAADKSANLIDPNELYRGYPQSNNGSWYGNEGFRTSGYIPCKPGETYYVNSLIGGNSGKHAIHYYTKDRVWICGDFGNQASDFTFTVPATKTGTVDSQEHVPGYFRVLWDITKTSVLASCCYRNNTRGVSLYHGPIVHKGNISNPNLLINSNFRINQRGGQTKNTVGYFVDHWTLDSGATAHWYDVPELILNGGMRQFIEDGEKILLGVTVTLSCMTLMGGVESVTCVLPSTLPSSNTTYGMTKGLNGCTAQIRYQADIGKFSVILNSSSTQYLRWVKLELGTEATPYVPPVMAEELVKCQRYFQKIKNMRVSCCLLQSNLIDFTLPLAIPMRAAGTVTIPDNLLTIQSISGSTVTGFTYQSYADSLTSIKIRCTKTNHGISNNASLTFTGDISVDAEL